MSLQRVLALATSAALALSGCGGTDPASSDGPRPGGSITIYKDRIPVSLSARELGEPDPATMFYGSLVRLEADPEARPYGVLAESLEMVKDPAHWQLRLRPSMRFTDDTPFDADAVKFNWEWHADPANDSRGAAVADQIDSMTLVDATTLDIVLAAPNTDFAADIATSNLNGIGSPTAMEADIEAFNLKPTGAGPFMVESFTADEINLVRNPDYFDPELPYLDEITIKAVPDFEQRRNALSTGENALGVALTAQELDDFRNLGTDVFESHANGGQVYMFNLAKEPLDDLRVRQAIIRALDLDSLDHDVYGGVQTMSRGALSADNQLFDESATQFTHDPVEAQRLIDEYVADNGGVVEFEILATNEADVSLEAQWIAQKLNSLNDVDVEVRTADRTSVVEAQVTKNFEMTYSGLSWVGSTADLRVRLLTDSPQNYGNYASSAMDDLLTHEPAVLDADDHKAIMSDIQVRLRDDAPILWTWARAEGYAASGRVNGVELWGEKAIIPEKLYVESS